MSLWVNEIFFSLQGESSHAGRPCVFVRLTGCNLRCSYCDTTYAYQEGEQMRLGEIITQVKSYGCRLVEITGGEPLIQHETPQLIENLLQEGMEVLLETNGSLNIEKVDPRCRRIMDIKLPSSGEHTQMRWENLDLLNQHDEVKFVIGNRTDYEYAVDILSCHPLLVTRPLPPLFSPVYGEIDLSTLATWILADKLPVRFQIPLHKVIWGETRGV